MSRTPRPRSLTSLVKQGYGGVHTNITGVAILVLKPPISTGLYRVDLAQKEQQASMPL